jgi:hypothetical protein
MELLKERETRGKFRWLQFSTLRESRNDVLERLIKSAGYTEIDLIDDERQRWVAAQRATGVGEMSIRLKGLETFAFAVLGDPGEADESQYCVVEPLKATISEDTEFMVVMSDVIYPTGETNDYLDAFYLPYRFYERPIYALPGNHDWYSLLTGFMWNFCDAEPLPPAAFRLTSYTWQERLARKFWLRALAPKRARLLDVRQRRPPWDGTKPDWPGWPQDAGGWPRQPGPYYTIDAENVRLVCIDTGITGDIDAEQGEWLLRVSSDSTLPKILLTGKPLYVNNSYEPGAINWARYEESSAKDPRPKHARAPRWRSWFRSSPRPKPGSYRDPRHRRFPDVDSIVREPAHNYIAAIGGDVHNYQRYPIQIPSPEGGRTLQYVVSGGGGAFLSPTHVIPEIHVPRIPCGVTPPEEKTFRCYPRRGDSLARYAPEFRRQIRIIFGWTLAVGLLVADAAYALHHYLQTTDDARGPALGLAIVAAAVTFLLVVGDWFRLRNRIAIVFAGALLVAAILVWPRWGVAGDAGVPFAVLGVVAIVGLRRWVSGTLLIAIAITAVSLMIAFDGTVYDLIDAWLWALALVVLLSALALLPFMLATVVGRKPDLDACAEYVAWRLDRQAEPPRARAPKLDRLTRLPLRATFPPHPHGPLYWPLFYSALFDFGTPPFFKNFLRFEVDEAGITVLVYAVTGFLVDEQAPRVEDSFRWRRSDGRWTTARAVAQAPGDPKPRGSIDFFADGGGGGVLVADLGEDFSPGTYRLAAKWPAALPADEEQVVNLGETEAAASPFEVRLRGIPLPPHGWFDEVTIARGDGLEKVFHFR